ncbi:MAG: hypothetical protein QFE16_02740 [Pseudomonadota bacterium]|nr:hypothetical protein [Pseudomonadota bacterium]
MVQFGIGGLSPWFSRIAESTKQIVAEAGRATAMRMGLFREIIDGSGGERTRAARKQIGDKMVAWV